MAKELNLQIEKSTIDNIATLNRDIANFEGDRKDANGGIQNAQVGIYCETLSVFASYPSSKKKISIGDMKVLKTALSDSGMSEGSVKRKAEKTQWAFIKMRKDGTLPTQATPSAIREILKNDYEVDSESKLVKAFDPNKPLSKAESLIRKIFGELKKDESGMKGGLDASDFAEFVTLYDAEKIAREVRVKAEYEAQAQKDAEVVAQDETLEAMDELLGDDMTSDDIPNAQDDMDNNPFGSSHPKTISLTELDDVVFSRSCVSLND